MRLRMYHAGDGDCLLLTDRSGNRHMLVDGGRKGTFTANTLSDLTMRRMDLVCVSHIDDDHISGILALFDAEVAKRRRAFENRDDPSFRQPPSPVFREVWHNALFALLGDDLEVRARNSLVLAGNLLRAVGRPEDALASENLANGEEAAMALARRLGPEQLDIPVNGSAQGALLTRTSARDRRIGTMRVKLIGPSTEDIDRLRVSWRRWIDQHPGTIDALRDTLRRDEDGLGTSTPVTAALGDGASGITPPNLASIMLVVEERIPRSRRDQSVLLTGDGDSAEILAGMAAKREIGAPPDGTTVADLTDAHRRHVTVFKIPHHGATANVTEELVARVTADHYVFCGNGAHHNPELEVVRSIAQARLDQGLGPADGFTFWFSSGPDTPGLTAARRKHMRDVRDEVRGLIARSNGRMQARFIAREPFLDVLTDAAAPTS